MIQSELSNGVRLLTLDRPESLNAFNTQQFELLAERMLEAQEDAATRVVVLTGAGRAFSAGIICGSLRRFRLLATGVCASALATVPAATANDVANVPFNKSRRSRLFRSFLDI